MFEEGYMTTITRSTARLAAALIGAPVALAIATPPAGASLTPRPPKLGGSGDPLSAAEGTEPPGADHAERPDAPHHRDTNQPAVGVVIRCLAYRSRSRLLQGDPGIVVGVINKLDSRWTAIGTTISAWLAWAVASLESLRDGVEDDRPPDPAIEFGSRPLSARQRLSESLSFTDRLAG
jgi:hypothetical protein